MIIEIGKKYKTRNGENVTIQRVAFNRVYGAISQSYKDGLFTIWNLDGTLVQSEMTMLCIDSGDLVEIKEDWEVLVEHFKNSEKPVMVTIDSDVFRVVRIPKVQLNEKLLEMIISSAERTTRQLKKDIKLATLEDCKKYILER